MKEFLELGDIPNVLAQRIKDAGGIEKFCEGTKLNREYLEGVLEGRLKIHDPYAKFIGLKAVTVYERIEEQ